MKKFLVIFAAALLMMGLAGQAHAFFQNGDLIRIVVNTAGNEAATDLGLFSSIQSGAITLNDAGNGISASTYNVPINSSDYVFYYVAVSNSPYTFYVANSQTGTFSGTNTALNYASAWTGTQNVLLNYEGSATATASGAYNAGDSYYEQLGIYFKSVFGASSAPGSLLTNLTTSNPITLEMWNFVKSATPVDLGLALYTNVDASGNIYTTDNVAPAGGSTPIPPSVLLFGSGLLGLIGLKRRAG